MTYYVIRVESSCGTGLSYLRHQNCCRKELREDVSGPGLMVSGFSVFMVYIIL